MRVHPAVHATWISGLFYFLMRLDFLSNIIEKVYDKTAWLRDLLKWESDKKAHKGRKKHK